MSQIVHRINGGIISEVVARHYDKFHYYPEIKNAVNALIGGAEFVDILSGGPGYSDTFIYSFYGTCRVFQPVDTRFDSSRPTKKTASSVYPLIIEFGYVLDSHLVSARRFIEVLRRNASVTESIAREIREKEGDEVPPYSGILLKMGIRPIYRISINMNYKG